MLNNGWNPLTRLFCGAIKKQKQSKAFSVPQCLWQVLAKWKADGTESIKVLSTSLPRQITELLNNIKEIIKYNKAGSSAFLLLFLLSEKRFRLLPQVLSVSQCCLYLSNSHRWRLPNPPPKKKIYLNQIN